jgi:hypothetical protein
MDVKSSFDSEWVLTWSVLAFVTIIDAHTSTATCSCSRERGVPLVGNGKWAENSVYTELYDCDQ